MPAPPTRRWPKFILLGVSTLLALAVVEVFLRVRYQHRRRAAVAAHLATDGLPTVAYSPVPDLYYVCRPNVAGTNSRGYFDVEHTFDKPADVFRIVVIGDSVAVGHGVGWRASFGKLLEQELNRRAVQRRVEVVILACSGYSTSQELVLLRNEAFEYHPDMVLWSYVLNDPAHPLFHAASGDLSLLYEPKLHLAHLLATAWFHAREWYAGRGGPKEFHERLHYIYWDQVVGQLDEIGRLCREHNLPCLFAIHRVFEPDVPDDYYSYRDLHANLEHAAAHAGLAPVDLREAYRGRQQSEVGLEDDPWHPTALGHRLLAQFLASYLLDGNWVATDER